MAAAHSVLFDSTGLIRHPAPWQRQDLNSSVKSLSTQTHTRSLAPKEEREAGDRGYLRPVPPSFSLPFLFLFVFFAHVIAAGVSR